MLLKRQGYFESLVGFVSVDWCIVKKMGLNNDYKTCIASVINLVLQFSIILGTPVVYSNSGLCIFFHF